MASGLCVPHKQAAHMAAPTEGQNIRKALANGEPSTHGAKRTLGWLGQNGSFWSKADIGRHDHNSKRAINAKYLKVVKLPQVSLPRPCPHSGFKIALQVA